MDFISPEAEFEAKKDNFLISTDKGKLQIDVIFDYLHNHSYWAENIGYNVIEKAIKNSLNFGLYENDKQIGFARAVTDLTTFAYLADVFILEAYRGKGLAKWLIETVLKHPELQGLRRWLLLTRDAQELYSQFGFKVFHAPERCMELWFPDVYKNT